MSIFIGSFGGFLMIVLIATLFFKLLFELFNVENSKVKLITQLASVSIILCLTQLNLGALIGNFSNIEIGSVFEIRNIWKADIVQNTFQQIDNFSFLSLLSQKQMPLYHLIVTAFSKILFNETDSCAFYISFISGVITYTSLGLLISNNHENDKQYTQKWYSLLLCIPGSIFLFLPSSLAFVTATISLFLLTWDFGKRK